MVNGRIGWALLAMSLAAACSGSPGVDVEESTRLDPAAPSTDGPAPTSTSTATVPPASDPPEPVDSSNPTDPVSVDLAGVGDSLYPALGNGGYDVEHYSLAIEADVDANVLDAAVTIEAVAVEELDVFHLDLQGLKVTTS